MKSRRMTGPSVLTMLALAGALAGCSVLKNASEEVILEEYPRLEVLKTAEGTASFYHNRFHGRKTASGDLYDKTALTAAHRSFPFGTIIRVTSLKNGNSVVVRVNDRGPSRRSRVIDLSLEAARCLEMITDGLVRVQMDVLSWGEAEPAG